LAVEPRCPVSAFASLPKSDRRRLRLAAVKACKVEADWRKLYGSHLSADERFFCVMYRRFSGHNKRPGLQTEGFYELERLAATQMEHASLVTSHFGFDGGGSAVPAALGAEALSERARATFNPAGLLSKSLLDQVLRPDYHRSLVAGLGLGPESSIQQVVRTMM